jgi:hypothetical protein
MANSTVAALPAAAALSGSELLYGVQSAADVKITAAQVKTLALAAPFAIPGGANTSVLTSTGYSLTGANAQNMIDLAGTWNTSGNPVALQIAITNTASGAAAKFVSLLGGAAGTAEYFSIDKTGTTIINGQTGTATTPFAVKYAGTSLFTVTFGGTVSILTAGISALGIGGGLGDLATVSSNYQVRAFNHLYLQAANGGTGTIHFGAADAAAPVAQTLSVQSVIAGTSNTAGVDLNITGSLSTGSGIAGKIVFNLSQIVAAATTQNASSSVLSLNTIAASGIQFPRYGAGALSTDASGNITATSDERLKHVVGNFKAGLAELMKIDPIVFKWREDSGMETAHEYVGFGAHNVQESMPEAVGQTPDGYLTLSDRALLAACVNAIKDLSGRVHK